LILEKYPVHSAGVFPLKSEMTGPGQRRSLSRAGR